MNISEGPVERSRHLVSAPRRARLAARRASGLLLQSAICCRSARSRSGRTNGGSATESRQLQIAEGSVWGQQVAGAVAPAKWRRANARASQRGNEARCKGHQDRAERPERHGPWLGARKRRRLPVVGALEFPRKPSWRRKSISTSTRSHAKCVSLSRCSSHSRSQKSRRLRRPVVLASRRIQRLTHSRSSRARHVIYARLLRSDDPRARSGRRTALGSETQVSMRRSAASSERHLRRSETPIQAAITGTRDLVFPLRAQPCATDADGFCLLLSVFNPRRG